jgi:UDP-N-acetylmuramate--alanine ligase
MDTETLHSETGRDSPVQLLQNLARHDTGARVYFVGIKGTGMCALAELMYKSGMSVSGSDTDEKFYTDTILNQLDIPYFECFDAAHIKQDFTLVIYSAAYSENENPELAEACRLSIPLMKYPDALGAWSGAFDSAGITGVHGKTTTTAMTGILARALNLPAQILAGSAVSGFDGMSTLLLGNKYFIAETCEYRRHFMAFHPRRILLTAVESDHQDYFPDYPSIRDAFVEYCRLLPSGGQLVYCADDKGAAEVAEILKQEEKELEFIPYGFSVNGQFGITNYRAGEGKAFFSVNAFPGEFILHIPGRHQVLNAAGALALCSVLLRYESGSGQGGTSLPAGWNKEKISLARNALDEFKGSKRRSEIIGEAGGILFMDDYGHHPTAIDLTLNGLKSFYPHRRLVVSFMSHTYTRTAALLNEFIRCFNTADAIILHEIYSSAREHYKGGVTGKTLYNEIKELDKSKEIYYFDKPMDAFETTRKLLHSGDLFITMGAGNNWPLGLALYNYFKEAVL